MVLKIMKIKIIGDFKKLSTILEERNRMTEIDLNKINEAYEKIFCLIYSNSTFKKNKNNQ